MFGVSDILIGILGLALLMIVHEAGHLVAARSFGLRVTTFSIGFGPTFFRIEPEDGYFWFVTLGGKVRLRLRRHDPEKHGPTVYQMAMIPFLAYVQIAGMNPFEDNDPEDEGSYANASLVGRITTIFGGRLANYLFASVFFFISYNCGGVPEHPPAEERDTVIYIIPDRPAANAGLLNGDRIVEVNGTRVERWDKMAEQISTNPGKEIEVVVERAGENKAFQMTPEDKDGRGLIGVELREIRRPVEAKEAAYLAVTQPTLVVKSLVVGIGRMITGKERPELGGPVMIVKESARLANRSTYDWLVLMGILSAYLGAFNLFPFPALDGGRLMFLGYEFATRRRPNARVEAHIHIVGLMMLLGLMVYVTIFGQNDLNLGGK